MIKELQRRLCAGLMAFAMVFANLALPVAPVFAAPAPANNGTLKVHEKGAPSNTESNNPKVCTFNFEGFGFDQGQSGLIKIEPQGGDSNATDTLEVPFGPAGNQGYAETAYINDGGALTLSDGHYKSTLYGKDTASGEYTVDLKAKSKVFKVKCDNSTPDPATPTVVVVARACAKINHGDGSATATITNVADETHATVTYTWGVEGTLLAGSITIKDGESAAINLSGLAAGVYKLLVNGSDFTSISANFTIDQCSSVIEQCEVVTGPTTISSKEQFADSDDDRSAGHYDFTAAGLRIWTDDASSNAKVAWYHNVDYPLSQVGVPTMDYTANSGIKPGLQLKIDFDGDGDFDGILVGEKDSYGDDWWLNNDAAQFVKDGAPSHTGGSGSSNHGTLNQWLTNFPEAQVKAVGFSLGSGVHADGVLHSLTIGCHTYTFTYIAPPKVATPVTPAVYDICYKDSDFVILPTVEGVIYKVNGTIPEFGEVRYDGTELVVTAEADSGYVLAEGAPTSWTFDDSDFTNEQCLTITKSAKVASDTNRDGKIGVGDTITWSITVKNTSDKEWESFYVIVDDENAILEDGGYIGSLYPGESKTITATSTITLEQARVCKATNVASFSGWRYGEGIDSAEDLSAFSGNASGEYVWKCEPGKGDLTPKPETPNLPETPVVLPNTSGLSTRVVAVGALSLASLVLLAGTAIKSRLLA